MNKHSEAVMRSQRKHRERFNAYQREYWSRPENRAKKAVWERARAERRKRETAYDRAVKRDSRPTKEETAARDKIRNYYRVQQWQERHREQLAFDRAVRRDDRLTSEERTATRRIRKNEQYRDWAIRNPERARQHAKAASVAYQARRRGAPGRASTDQVAARWAYYADRCWMCGEPATQTDHVIPLSRGGSNWPANLRPACGPCNREKWDTLLPI